MKEIKSEQKDTVTPGRGRGYECTYRVKDKKDCDSQKDNTKIVSR